MFTFPFVTKSVIGLIPLLGLVFAVTILYFKSKKQDKAIPIKNRKGIEKKTFIARLIYLPIVFCWIS